MRKYYTRPCNFYYGNYAKHLVKIKKALPLAGNNNISFDQLEIFERKKGKNTKTYLYSINEIKKLNKEVKDIVRTDLKKITSKRKSLSKIKFDNPHIMGVLNITPDSFSDGGLFFDELKAYKQGELMINDGASIIDIGGESTRPGSKLVDEKKEWARIKNTIEKYNFRFKKKCFHEGEIRKSESRLKSIESYAKRYAAKEACAKALGTGLARGVFWKDIEVYNDQYGKPKIKLHNKALNIFEKLNKNKGVIEVSLSDEMNYAIANVTIYAKE